MAKELEHHDTPGLTIYAKPSPLTESPWATGVVALTESGTVAGYYSADVATPADQYVIFRQAGGSPAGTDEPVGTVNIKLTAAQVNAEVGTALADYDGPTRTEATSDKDEVLASVSTVGGNVTAILEDTGTTLPANQVVLDGKLNAVQTKTDQLVFTGGRLNAALPAVDGISDELFRAVLLAFATGLNTVTEVSPDERQVEFMLQDGTTVIATVNYDPADGQRVSVSLGSLP